MRTATARRRRSRRWLAPAATGLLLLAAWTEPQWSDLPDSTGLTITAGPQLRGAGPSPAAARNAGFGLDVVVDGAGAGHPVQLEMWSDDGWRPEDEGATDAEGHVHLVASRGAYGRILADVDGSRVERNFDATTAGPTLVVNEEFDGDLLGPAWLTVPQPADGTTCAMMGVLAKSVAAGQLALAVLEDPTQICEGAPLVVNGHVVLQAPVAHGTVAARIKFPPVRSVSAQFWLQPGDPTQRWVMDRRHEGVVIAETRGTGVDPGLGTSLNRRDGGRVSSSPQLLPPESAPTDGEFHVYAVTWTPTGFVFSVDGETVREVSSTTPAPPLSIGMSVTPTRPGRPAPPEDTTMFVDWLRVWNL